MLNITRSQRRGAVLIVNGWSGLSPSPSHPAAAATVRLAFEYDPTPIAYATPGHSWSVRPTWEQEERQLRIAQSLGLSFAFSEFEIIDSEPVNPIPANLPLRGDF